MIPRKKPKNVHRCASSQPKKVSIIDSLETSNQEMLARLKDIPMWIGEEF